MRTIKQLLFLGLICAVFLAGCGGYSSPSTMPGTQSAKMSLSATDAPPAGVTVFSFEVTLTGATLNGTGIYATNIDLLSGKGPQRIEVKHLETENAFLNLANVTPGTYTALNLTFSNPELTFRNDTATAIAGCAPAAVCEIKPTGTLTATVNGQFNPSMGTTTAVLLDLNLNTLLTQSLGVDFTTAGAVTATQQTMKTGGDMEDLDNLEGIVASAGAVSGDRTTGTRVSCTRAANPAIVRGATGAGPAGPARRNRVARWRHTCVSPPSCDFEAGNPTGPLARRVLTRLYRSLT